MRLQTKEKTQKGSTKSATLKHFLTKIIWNCHSFFVYYGILNERGKGETLKYNLQHAFLFTFILSVCICKRINICKQFS